MASRTRSSNGTWHVTHDDPRHYGTSERLSSINLLSLDWQQGGTCEDDSNPNRWFRHGGNWYDLRETCFYCPVKDECLEWAVQNDEAGFWGGYTRAERRELKVVWDGFERVKENTTRTRM